MKIFPKLLLYFVSITGLCLMSAAIIMACSDEPDPYDYYTSFFHPDIQGRKEYGAFYFTDYQFTYGDEEPESEAAINSAEWAKYLGGKVKPADVERIMYHLDSAGKDGALDFFEQDQAAADSLTRNSFLISLKEPGHDDARKYYHFAVGAELLGQSNYNYWEPAPVDTGGLKDEAAKAVESAMEENDSFLKLRYFYQAQKLNHYAGNFEEAKKIFDQHIAPSSSSSHVKGWALALKAGEERRLGDTIQAAYLFSKVFALYPERRLQAYRNYHYIDAPFDKVIKLAQTPVEKANLYAIKGFANPEVETDNLEEVYENAPSSSMVGVLLLREINKLEQYYLTPALNNNNDLFYSDRSGLNKQGPDANSGSKKWLLWAAAITILLAVILLALTYKKKEVKDVYRVLGGAVILAGTLAVVWFYFSQQPQAASPEQLPQGKFFVAMPDSVKTKYEAHIEKLRSFCTKLSSDGQYAEPQIGGLTSAYLYFIQNKPDDGLAALQKLDGQRLSDKLNDQKQIVKLLLSSQHIKQLKAVDEASLLPSLKWLHEKSEGDNQFAITQRNFYTHVLAPAYLRQGDTARAALAMLKSNLSGDSNYNGTEMPGFWYNYLHTAQLQQVITWKSSVTGDQYLKFFSHDLARLEADKLFELLGTIALREHRYNNAVAAFQHIKDRKLISKSYNGEDSYSEGESYQGDPFMVETNDYPKYFGGKHYTKLTFAQKMAELEDQLRLDPKNSDAFFQLANGLYNTSMYGNSWGLISYSWSANDYGRKQLYYYDSDYIKASQAKQYYLKARDLSHDPELKAKCTFMAAKCEQKEHVSPSFMDDYDTYVKREKQYAKQLRENSYFREMQQYKKTLFYQKALNECSYLSDFIKSN